MILWADPVVDWAALFEVVWSALAAGIGVTGVFALGILGATRAVDMRRNGHGPAAGLYALLTALAFAGVLGAVVFGIVVMSQK